MEQVIEEKKENTSVLRKISFTIVGVLLGGFGLLTSLLGCVGGCYGYEKMFYLYVGGASSLIFLFSTIILGYKKSKILVIIASLSLVVYILVGFEALL